MPRYLTLRLCVLVFLGFATMGAWVPVFTLHLKNLHFSPNETAWASAANAVGALLGPLIWGQFADRWISTERCISLCAAMTSVGLWALAQMSEPLAIVLTCVGVWLFLMPALGLINSYIFRRLELPERNYGKVRLWGTVGWIVAGLVLSLWYERAGADLHTVADLTDSLRLASLIALTLMGYSLTMPHTPPHPRTTDAPAPQSLLLRLIDAPISALRLFHNRSFVVYIVCMFAVYVTIPFTIQLNPLLLDRIGFASKTVPRYLTISQSTEVLFLAFLPLLLMRLGMKKTMLLGNIAWTLGLATLSKGSPTWLVIAGLASHGIFICCFFLAGQVFVNRQATHDIRASAQGLILLISGVALLLGHLLVGWVRALSGDDFAVAYLCAASIAGLASLSLLIGFNWHPGNAYPQIDADSTDSDADSQKVLRPNCE